MLYRKKNCFQCLPHLLEVFVIIDVFAFRGILESIAPYVLPHSVDDVWPLSRMDTQQPGQLAGQFVLNRLQTTSQLCHNKIGGGGEGEGKAGILGG